MDGRTASTLMCALVLVLCQKNNLSEFEVRVTCWQRDSTYGGAFVVDPPGSAVLSLLSSLVQKREDRNLVLPLG